MLGECESYGAAIAAKASGVKGKCLHLATGRHSFRTRMPYQPGSSAQRIRIGLTGLAFAFILVLLGSIISRSSREDSANAVHQTAANEASEPLAELGIAPDASNDSASNNSATAKK